MKFNPRSARQRDNEPSSSPEAIRRIPPQTPAPLPPSNGGAPSEGGSEMLSLLKHLNQNMQELRSEQNALRREFQEMAAQQGVQQNIFDALHTELGDYKNDFVGERIKPMVGTLLFLYDAINGFSSELDVYVDPPDWLGERVLTKGLIDSNLGYFREHLDEVLRMCELQPLKAEVGMLADPKTQNLISTEATDDATMDNHIQKVVRTGWMQGERVFRPTEVVIWKAA